MRKPVRIALLLLLTIPALSRAATDIGVDSILSPSGDGRQYVWFTPKALWHNYGTMPSSFRAWLVLSDSFWSIEHRDSVTVANLAPGSDTVVEFDPYYFPKASIWMAKCSTYALGDTNPSNDAMTRFCNIWPWNI